jgi:DNA repair protein RecO (recombination protein O)
MGKVRLLAKGSRRGKTNFGGPLEPWMRAEALFSLRDPNRLGTLTEFYEVEGFRGLREDLQAYRAACCITELVLALVPDLQPQSRVFDLTIDVLRLLARGRRSRPEKQSSAGRGAAKGRKKTGAAEASDNVASVMVFYFEVQLLQMLGYWPGFRDACIECDRKLPTGSLREFSPSLGGLLCQACKVKTNDVIVLKPKAVEAMEFLTQAKTEQLQRVRLNPETARQMRTVMKRMTSQILGRELVCGNCA